jgi:hypothetical protein
MREYSEFSENFVIETQGAGGNAGAWPYGALVQQSATPNSVTVTTTLNWAAVWGANGAESDGVEWYFAATLSALTSAANIANPAFVNVNPFDGQVQEFPTFVVQNLQPYNYYYVRARAYRDTQQ